MRLKWGYKKFVKFLESYGFTLGHSKGSHFYYNGKINGEQAVVGVVFSNREKDCQSVNTIKLAIKHSSIPKEYFEEWDKTGKIYEEIID